MKVLLLRGLVLALLLFWSPTTTFAEVAAPPTANLTTSPIASLFRILTAFGLVLAVFAGVVWVLKNWQRFTVPKGLPVKLRVLEAKALGQRHALYVVGYDEQRLLLAASGNGVTLLTQLPNATAEERSLVNDTVPGADWAGLLGRLTKPNSSGV